MNRIVGIIVFLIGIGVCYYTIDTIRKPIPKDRKPNDYYLIKINDELLLIEGHKEIKARIADNASKQYMQLTERYSGSFNLFFLSLFSGIFIAGMGVSILFRKYIPNNVSGNPAPPSP